MARPPAEAQIPAGSAGQPAELPGATGRSAGPIFAALAALAAAWIAAGSTGLLGHGLRHALAVLALLVAILADLRGQAQSPGRLWVLLLAAAGAIALTASDLAPVSALSAAVLLCGLAVFDPEAQTRRAGRDGPARRIYAAAALAAAVLGIYRVLYTSVAGVWMASDALGGWLGRLAGAILGRPTWLGATFAGVDFLVVSIVLAATCVAGASGRRWKLALAAALAIAGGHLAYLLVIASAADLERLLQLLPKADPHQGWSWAGMVQAAVPWNLPAVGAITHLLVAGGLLAWTPWRAGKGSEPPAEAAQGPEGEGGPSLAISLPRWLAIVEWAALVLVAAALPAAVLLHPPADGLKGKTVIAYEEGLLNWLKPQHGEYGRLRSVGMYGMLEQYIRCLGGAFHRSSDLSQQDLDDAAVLILFCPDKPWQPGQLDRIEGFVRRGGSLLVMSDHTPLDEGGGVRANDVLAATGIQVPFYSAIFAVGGWLHSYEPLAHPATAGIGDDRNQFGVVIGAPLDVRWPAAPLLIGKWGWADLGDEGHGQSKLGDWAYNPGEKLGDLVLAAESRLGKGTVIAFGDTSSMNNGITPASYVFTSRLLGYLAARGGSGQAPWRQATALILAAGLLALLVLRAGRPLRIAAAVLALATSLTVCTVVARRASEVLPDGRSRQPNELAYIDTSHMGGFTEESWRADGLGGLELTLMRNGFLALTLPDFDPRRLQRAGLVISVAPQRQFTRWEREAVRQYVEGGGIFIVTAGYDLGESAARPLLEDFGFQIGNIVASPDADVPEPQPMGHRKNNYLGSEGHYAWVRYHAAWPVACEEKDLEIIARGTDGRTVIAYRPKGKGKFVVIGDALFPTCQNLEREGGEPFEGLYENADFWRWFLTILRGQQMWVPPAAIPPSETEPTPPASGPTISQPAAGNAATAPAREAAP